MRIALSLIAVATGLALYSNARAESTAVRVQQVLAAINSDDAELLGKLLDTPEVSIDQKYSGKFTWTHAAADRCSFKAMSLLLDKGAPFTGDENRLLIGSLSQPTVSSKCIDTANVALKDWDFNDPVILHDGSQTSQLQQYFSNGGCLNSPIGLKFMILHDAEPGPNPFPSGRNLLQQATMHVNANPCLESFKALVIKYKHQSVNTGAVETTPADWVLEQLNETNPRGNRAIDLLNMCFQNNPNPDAVHDRQEAANILLQLGSSPARNLTTAQCRAEIFAPSPAPPQ